MRIWCVQLRFRKCHKIKYISSNYGWWRFKQTISWLAGASWTSKCVWALCVKDKEFRPPLLFCVRDKDTIQVGHAKFIAGLVASVVILYCFHQTLITSPYVLAEKQTQIATITFPKMKKIATGFLFLFLCGPASNTDPMGLKWNTKTVMCLSA